MNSYLPCLLQITILRFTCGARKICSNIKLFQNVMTMIEVIGNVGIYTSRKKMLAFCGRIVSQLLKVFYEFPLFKVEH